MKILSAVFTTIIFVVWFIALIKLYLDNRPKNPQTNITKFMVRVAIFGSIAAILYTVPILKFPVPFFPSFLEFHFDEIPIFIAGFAYGPWTALAIIVLKTLIKLPFSGTLMVGELSDLLFSTAFILPATIIYKKIHTIKGAIIGLFVGMVIQVAIAMVGNVYAMVPFYMYMYGLDSNALLGFCKLANPKITNVQWSYAFLAVLPFNLMKDAIVMIVTFLVYKNIHRYLDKVQA
ncbi:MAG: ECF transporter S component [Bacilli bacterium]|nr:ECF transporter S component [Bacilli bacterium]